MLKQSPMIVAFVAAFLFSVSAASGLFIETVPVGNPGNAGELSGAGAGGSGPDRICGAVDYTYNIGKYEVTAGQYTEFLNAVAKTDTYGLYNVFMNYDADPAKRGCNIKRGGRPGGFAYSVAADWANRPVDFVSWGDAARFANWMHNGQPTGAQGLATTEDGSYFLNGAMSNVELMALTRKTDATWVIPSEDEWYKAAYHKNDGVTGYYFDYATGSDSPPSNALDGGGNNATFYDGGHTVDSPYYSTEVGAHENSESLYGTFDQCGNVWEWNEAMIGSERGDRGGYYYAADRQASGRGSSNPTYSFNNLGIRLVYVPEPTTLAMFALGGLAVMRRR